MADFVNTVDLLGNDAVMDAIIDRTITEFNDNVVASIRTNAFYKCTSLISVNIPAATKIDTTAFSGCSSLQKIDTAALTSIGNNSLQNCSNLTALILRNTTAISALASNWAINNSPIKNGTCYVYVPSSMLSQYTSNSYWSAYSAQFRKIEDYPDICG